MFWVRKVIKIFIGLALMGCICAVIAYKFSWRLYFTPEEMQYNASLLQKAPTPPQNFMKIWNKLLPYDKPSNSMFAEITTTFLPFLAFRDCKCDEVSAMVWGNKNTDMNTKNDIAGKGRLFALGLEYYASPEDCFSFWLNKDIYWNNRFLNNLDEFSQILFQKNVVELQENELIRLIAHIQTPYSLNLQRVEEKIREYQKILKEE